MVMEIRKLSYNLNLSLGFIMLVFICACGFSEFNTKSYDLSLIFKYHQDQLYGYAGEHYQRLQLRYDSIYMNDVTKDYDLTGSITYKGKIIPFKGNIMPQANRSKQKGTYVLVSNLNLILADSSIIDGKFTTLYYIKDGRLLYDDRSFYSDSYMNNFFVGTWKRENVTLKCCWGEFRIPDSGDLDIGAGEFSPNEKYYQFGWKDFE